MADPLTRQQTEWAKNDERERAEALQLLLKCREGRRYLYWILESSKAIGVSPFHADPYITAFNCGEHNLGLRVLAHLIETAPEGFTLLMKEAADERYSRSRIESELRDAAGRDPGNGDASDSYLK